MGSLPNGGHGSLRGRQSLRLTLCEDEKVAPRHALDGTEDILTRELAIHRGQAPESPPLQLLAELKTVAEKPQIAAHLDRFVLDYGQAVVTSRRRTGEDALPYPIDDGLLQAVAAKAE